MSRNFSFFSFREMEWQFFLYIFDVTHKIMEGLMSQYFIRVEMEGVEIEINLSKQQGR